jgi:hypothetical protein
VELERQTIEIERQVANESAQALVRAEATVSGAGREAVEPLMEEATMSIGAVEVQDGRVLLDGTVRCQAVYRQGEEGKPRLLGQVVPVVRRQLAVERDDEDYGAHRLERRECA